MSCAVFIYIIPTVEMCLPKVVCDQTSTEQQQGWSRNSEELQERIYGDFHPGQWRCLHHLCWIRVVLPCHLGSGPEGQNIQGDTGGINPISKHLTMGALKLHKYSLSEFQ